MDFRGYKCKLFHSDAHGSWASPIRKLGGCDIYWSAPVTKHTATLAVVSLDNIIGTVPTSYLYTTMSWCTKKGFSKILILKRCSRILRFTMENTFFFINSCHGHRLQY